MNERIKELVIKTLGKEGVIASRAFGHWALSDEEMEKFAQLIVEECARRAEAYAYMSENFTALAEELRRMVDEE